MDEIILATILDEMDLVWGLISFTLGGALLLAGVFYTLENVNKPWIDVLLFMGCFVAPVGFAAFFLLGLGLFLLIRSACRQRTSPPP